MATISEREEEEYTHEDYDNMLDEEGVVVVGGLNFSPSDIIKNLDPIAYRCGFNDFQKYKTVYICDDCGLEYDDEDEAKECCTYECEHCGTVHDDEDEARECCESS
jgi:hypothetical protein